jgi:hypothetical protein
LFYNYEIHQTRIIIFFCGENLQNVKKGASKSPFGKKWIKKKVHHILISAKHKMPIHGVDPSLLTLQGTHPSLPHSLKRPVVAISHLPLLGITNFITVQEVPSPSLNEEETCVAIHTISFVFLRHILLLGHIYFVGT